MRKLRRVLAAAAGLLAVGAVIAVGGSAAGAAGSGKHTHGVLYSAITHTVGSTEYLAGNSSDKLLGPGAATYTATLGTGSKPGTLKVYANVVLYDRSGSLAGKVTATLVTNKDNSVSFTNGKFTAAHGQGAQKGHSLSGTFTGSGQSILGPFVFHYKAIYK